MRLRNVYGMAAFAMSRIRGISRLNGNSRKNAETNISDRSYSGRPAASVTVNKTKPVDALITVKRRMSITNICESLHCSTCILKISLCYLKVCAKWFPRMLINSTKKQRIVSSQKLQELSNEQKSHLISPLFTIEQKKINDSPIKEF